MFQTNTWDTLVITIIHTCVCNKTVVASETLISFQTWWAMLTESDVKRRRNGRKFLNSESRTFGYAICVAISWYKSAYHTTTKNELPADSRAYTKPIFGWSGRRLREVALQKHNHTTPSLNNNSSSSYPFPTKWGRYNLFSSCCDKDSAFIFTNGRLPDVNPPWNWWMLTTANTAGTNSLTFLPKHTLIALTARPSSSSIITGLFNNVHLRVEKNFNWTKIWRLRLHDSQVTKIRSFGLTLSNFLNQRNLHNAYTLVDNCPQI
jgi:hypothetical protein